MLADMLDISMVDFRDMHRRLSRAGMPTLKKAQDALTDTLNLARAVQVIRDCGVDQRPELKTLFAISSASGYIEASWDLVKGEIPMYDALFDEEDEDGEPVEFIHYALIGFNEFISDDISEVLESPGERDSLTVFILFLVTDPDLGRPEKISWDAARKYYRWPEFEPFTAQVGGNDAALAIAKRYLESHDSSDLIGAIEVGFFPPYNLFYTPNPEDGSYEPLERNAENIAFVMSEWKEAKPYFEHYNTAMAAIEREPERLLVLIEALKEAGMIEPDRERVQVLTCGQI